MTGGLLHRSVNRPSVDVLCPATLISNLVSSSEILASRAMVLKCAIVPMNTTLQLSNVMLCCDELVLKFHYEKYISTEP